MSFLFKYPKLNITTGDIIFDAAGKGVEFEPGTKWLGGTSGDQIDYIGPTATGGETPVPSGVRFVLDAVPVGTIANQTDTDVFEIEATDKLLLASGNSSELEVNASGTLTLTCNNMLLEAVGTGVIDIGGSDTFGKTVKSAVIAATNISTSNDVVVDSGATPNIGIPTSLRRYKDVIEPLDHETALKLEPVIFRWKETGSLDVGLIAEDVEKVNPLFCAYHENELRGVNYSRIALACLATIKHQEERIYQLENTIKKIWDRIDEC